MTLKQLQHVEPLVVDALQSAGVVGQRDLVDERDAAVAHHHDERLNYRLQHVRLREDVEALVNRCVLRMDWFSTRLSLRIAA